MVLLKTIMNLENFLGKNGYTFYSQTDTEVVPNLIDYYYNKDSINDDKKSFKSCCFSLQ